MVGALVLAVFAAAQLPQDSTYASEAVRGLVTLASVQAGSSVGIVALTAIVETEVSLLIQQGDGEQVATATEQLGGSVTWRSDGSLIQTVIQYRGRMMGPAISSLSYMKGPWIIGPFVGDRVALLQAGSSTTPEARPWRALVNPFSSDRAAYYRYSGGDTVLLLRLPDRTIPVVRISVAPTHEAHDAFTLRGEVDLDAVSHQVVRVRGEVVGKPRSHSSVGTGIRAMTSPRFFLDLENALREGATWLPYRQWVELEVESPLSTERGIIRLVSDFNEVKVNRAVADALGEPGLAPGRSRALLLQLDGSLATPWSWRSELGDATAERDANDFDDLRWQGNEDSGEASRFRLSVPSLSHALRFDRVEGLFTGAGLTTRRSQAGGGRLVALYAGYGWAEHALRGGVEARVLHPNWSIRAEAARNLESTNDFPRVFAARPNILGVLGTDDFDYVDRYAASLAGTLRRVRGVSIEVELGAARDRSATVHASRAPLGRALRSLRPVEDGTYRYVELGMVGDGGRGGDYLASGVSWDAKWQLASGDLTWQRAEAELRGRGRIGRVALVGDLHGGVVSAEKPPPQVLFELGGYAGRLLGFPYKAFAGDRAMVGALQAAYGPPLVDRPLPLGPFLLPALAPSPTIAVSAGWTGASPAALEVMGPIGWAPSDRVRGSVFLGILLFGNSIRLGWARPLAEGGPWRWEFGLQANR